MEDKQKVIFIEDDPNLGLIIVLALQSKGYEVCYANTLSGIQDMIEKDCPNILLLRYWKLAIKTHWIICLLFVQSILHCLY